MLTRRVTQKLVNLFNLIYHKYLSINSFMYLSIYLIIYYFFIYLFIYLTIYLFI